MNNKQAALIKLATVRMAINHVLRMRGMQKQADLSDVYNSGARPDEVKTDKKARSGIRSGIKQFSSEIQ